MSCEGAPRSGLSKIKYKVHMAMCETCRAYAQKIESLDQAIRKVVAKKEKDTQAENQKVEEIVKEVIKKQSGG